MSIQKLERVLYRLRQRNRGSDEVSWKELQRAIMYEIGTDKRTYSWNRAALIKLGWIRSKNNKQLYLTNKDLE